MFKDYGGQISGSIYSVSRCVSGVIRVVYETINQGGAYETTRSLQARASFETLNITRPTQQSIKLS
jgi:hypothetical protein